ncbi:acyl-coenzyme A diphosphatase NUDT19-like isoform X2 [Periplaneta americana]|uniref:acyl-coenzyme A diphosphatase NUDT19-like isoform X2 n=1 Tax=Periplaneta americana TaxID=6978 RepID=UPI0037E95260
MSKYWREASSVIITARISFPKTVTASGKHGFAACKVDSLNKNAVNTVEGISTEDQKSRTTNFKWSTPEEVLDLCVKNKVILPPPQFYELARLNKFDNIEELTSFAAEHSSTESELWMPVRIKTSDGELTVFPGDDLYPDRPNYESSPPQKVDNSILDLRKQSNRLHRMEHSKECNTRLLITNLNSVGSHIVPLPVPS